MVKDPVIMSCQGFLWWLWSAGEVQTPKNRHRKRDTPTSEKIDAPPQKTSELVRNPNEGLVQMLSFSIGENLRFRFSGIIFNGQNTSDFVGFFSPLSPPFRLRARPSYQHTATNANATGYRLLRGRLQLSLCGRFATPRQLGPNLRTWCHLESDSCTSLDTCL